MIKIRLLRYSLTPATIYREPATPRQSRAYPAKRFFTLAGLLLATITGNSHADNGHVLGMLHGTFLDSCQTSKFCTQDARTECQRVFRAAFVGCDKLFYQDPESDKFTNCIANQALVKTAKITSAIDWAKCPRPPLPYVYKSEAIGPNDHPLVPEYFTFNSLDARFPELVGTVEAACQMGAERVELLASQKGESIVKVSIRSIDKLPSYGPNPQDTNYTHLFSTPSYGAGTCFGIAKTTILKSNNGFRKGEVIKSDYSDDVFVALQCHKTPLHKLCEPLPTPPDM